MRISRMVKIRDLGTRYFKKAVLFPIAMVLILATVSCKNQDTQRENSETQTTAIKKNMTTNEVEKNLKYEVNEKIEKVIGNYQYPKNPAEQLKNALESDTNKRKLPMRIGSVEKIEFENKECSQIKINFTNGNKNMCIITFINKHLDYGYDELLDGLDNPSFTIAFKDQDKPQDMVTILTSVIKYLYPELSFEEAGRLATKQDTTISTDGYSMPQDISGYQIQSRYTNPHLFVRTPDFDSKLGVKVTAIKQMWGTLDTQECQELKTLEDYELLDIKYWEEGKYPAVVYADFIVKNMWQDQSYIHGETWVVVDVESMTGRQYSLVLNTWDYPNTYEFGVGQKYTFYVRLNFHAGIIYAIQRSESTEFNCRGEVQPIDYPTVDWNNPVVRIEPEVEDTVYNVMFLLESQSYGEAFAALHGRGIGQKQWPNDPTWKGYTFLNWYDNFEWNGSPYTKDTPIYKDTYLYARWKYTGSGGVWPRDFRGNVKGIGKGSSLTIGQKLTITANGYNMNLESPKDHHFRWKPVMWKISDGTSGVFSNDSPYQTELAFDSKGQKILYITYLEEVFDGIYWQETGQLHEVEELMFRIDG